MSEFKKTLNQKAVALRYDENKNPAPVVVASGSGYMAERLVEIANAHDVPVFEDNSLASILSQLELGQQIPESLYQTIVDIYIYFLNFSPQAPRTGEGQDEAGAEGEATALDGSPEDAQAGT